jgi:hypothetical protein
MQIVDPRREIKGEKDVYLKCKPIFGTYEMTAPVSHPKARQFTAGTIYPVDIKLQYRERIVPMKITSSTPPGSVEFQARIEFGTSVEFEGPRPASWTPGRVYHMRKVRDPQQVIADPRMTRISGNVTVRITMRDSSVRVTIPNVIVPRRAAARYIINAWWGAVETNHIVDPNILCLSRDSEAFDIQDEDGNQIWPEEGVEIFLSLLNKTSPEVVHITVTWDGHDEAGLPLKLSITPKVHREEHCSRLLSRWNEHYKTHPVHAEIASQLFTDENEYYLTD